jgi:choline dehydrogenase-like flavoprotein
LGEFLMALSPKETKELARRDRDRPHERPYSFTAEESALVKVLADLIVPSDATSPGAEQMGVRGRSAVETLDRLVAGSQRRRAVYARGLLALDRLAQDKYKSPFIELSWKNQLHLLQFVDRLHQQWSKPISLTAKVKAKIVILYHKASGLFPAVELFPRLVQDVLQVFYTDRISWGWLDYDGPPMPAGYPNLLDRRSPVPEAEAQSSLFSSPLTSTATPRATKEQARSVNSPRKKQTTDVIVIGCGAGGGVIAKELGEAGLTVVVLEAGRRYDPHTDYPTDRVDFEVRAKTVFGPEDDHRDRYTVPRGNWFSYNRVKGVGGSTLHYEAISPRLHESDFRVRSADGVADDWPISYQDVEPYYTRVEYELGVSGPDGAQANPFDPPRGKPYPTPPHEFNCASKAVKRGADQLGLHMVREPLAIPTQGWNGRPACIGAGTCHLGCAISAKSSIDVTYVPRAEATGRVEIRPECMAREITIGSDGKARSVVYFDAAGREQEISARAIVVAGNPVETPRLLLMSTSSQFPDGLANSSGLVGKYFTEHLAVFTYGLFSERLDPWRGTPSGGFIQDYYQTNPRNNFARGWTIVVTNSSHWPLSVARRVPGWGAEHKALTKKLFAHFTGVASIGEQLPDVRNQVTLDPIVKDNFGLPVPHLVNKAHENDQAMIKAISARLKELFEAAGAIEIWGNEQMPGMSSHYLGTCRMGRNPSTSVVDPWCRTHDVPNLFIGDGSVFVTGGAVNPALTISALATRTAEGIVAAFRRREL